MRLSLQVRGKWLSYGLQGWGRSPGDESGVTRSSSGVVPGPADTLLILLSLRPFEHAGSVQLRA